MMTIYNLKPGFQSLLRPLLVFFANHKVTPNMLTVMALIGSAFTGGTVLLARLNPAWLIILSMWLFVRMALNALDGMMAREFHMATDTGAILNEVGDVLSDLVLYLPLALLESSAFVPIVLFCFGAFMTEFCGVLGQALGAGRRYEGPLGKSDRAFMIGAIALITALFPNMFIVWKWLFLGGALLSIWTCGVRVQATLRECQLQQS